MTVASFGRAWVAALLGMTYALALTCYTSAWAQEPGADAEAVDIDSGTEINVKNAEIASIIRIFSRKTKRNFILDERVKGKVSIYLPGKVSDEEALRILDSVLALKGFSAVPISENLWKILPSKEAKQSTIPTTMEPSGETPSAAMVTRLVNLKFIGADDAKTLIAPLISGDGLLNAYTGTNSLILIDYEDNVERLVALIDSLDVPFTDREMSIIPVKYADAVDLAAKLSEILGIGQPAAGGRDGQPSSIDLIRARMRDAAAANAGGAAAGQGQSASSGVQATTVSARSREPKLIPDERTNSIILVADEDTTARIRALVSELDSEVDLSGRRFYVYRCKYANAEELAQALGGIGGDSSSSSSTRSTTASQGSTGGLFGSQSGRTSSGLSGRSTSLDRTQSRLASQQRLPGQSRGTDGGTGGGAVSLGDNISITADPATNSLIINADKSDYMKLLELLKELDIRRRQVLVEAILLEVGIDDSVSMSTQFLVSGGGADGGVLASNDFSNRLDALFADPRQLSNFSVAAASAGTLTLPGDITIPTQSVLVNAASNNTNVNVLSAPNILATDNEPAEIVVGQNVPFLASTSTSGDNLNNTFNQIDRQDVGITLRLTPQISGEDLVRLQIFTEVSSVIAATLASELGPTTTIRTSETSVIAKDGQMIVIGGLMSDDVTDSESGVPFLRDIPVIGHVFRESSEDRRRKNLLIFITPRIIRDQYDARDRTIAGRDSVEREMELGNMWPRREEILRGNEIDAVAETNSFSKQSLGTILPPDKSAADGPGAAVAPPLDNSQAIELKVAPRLPGDSASAAARVATEDRYIVLDVSGKGKPSDSSLPFRFDPSGRRFGIHIPSESAALARDFFQTGAACQYSVDTEKKLDLRVAGIFPSAAEAQTFAGSELTEFYTLSPFELFNLGQGPWLKQ